MIIYVVKPGDSVWSVSRLYGADPDVVISLNGLSFLPYLVPGMALVIPGGAQPAKPRIETNGYIEPIGEAAERKMEYKQTNEQEKLHKNTGSRELNTPADTMGILATRDIKTQADKTDTSDRGREQIEIMKTAVNQENMRKAAAEDGSWLTYISPFSYAVRYDGSLKPIKDDVIIESFSNRGAVPQMVLTNFGTGNFDSDLAAEIMTNEQLQRKILANAIAIMRQKGYKSLNIDFERIPPVYRQQYNNFLRLAVDTLHPLGYTVSTALAPKPEDYQTGAWHGAHDYREHGRILDFVVLMTYEWGWSGGPPYAVAPINLVRQVLNYAVSVIPRNKILMGMPLYGYDWPLPYMPKGDWAKRVSPLGAIQLAAKYGANIQYNSLVQAPFFYYNDEAGITHLVWFEDARSADAKLKLAVQYGLRGVSFWVLGLPFPQLWALLAADYTVVKL